MDAFEYYESLMRQGTVSVQTLQEAWRFDNDYPRRPYLALMGRQLELPHDVHQAVACTELQTDDEGNFDLATFSLHELPDHISAAVREKLAEALAGLRMSEVLRENAAEIDQIGLDRDTLAPRLQAVGKAWYLRDLAAK